MNIGQIRTVINLSTQKYWVGQDRLKASINGSYNTVFWKHEQEVGTGPHSENNYSFKPLAFKIANEIGYKKLLWLDASINVIKDLRPIFDIIETDGYFFQDSGWMNERWTNDRATKYFGTNKGKMLSSGILGLNLGTEIGVKFLSDWLQSMYDGIFNGSWDNHRHDQTCASIIAYKLGMKLQDGNTFMVYGKITEPTISDKTLVLADGIV